MITLVVSGGQTGADLGGWRAAKKAGITCSGWMPKGFLTEDGSRPEFADLYGAREHTSPEYPPRTRMNIAFVAEKSGSLIIFDTDERISSGTKLAIDVASDLISRRFALSLFLVRMKRSDSKWEPAEHWHTPRWFARQITEHGKTVIVVAGNRESKAPGIGDAVECYMAEVFRLLGQEATTDA